MFWGSVAVLGALGVAGFGLGYLADQTGEAVADAGTGALKLAGAAALATATWYAWERI